MEISLVGYKGAYPSASLVVLAGHSTKIKNETKLAHSFPKEITAEFSKLKFNQNFAGGKSEIFNFNLTNGTQIKMVGLGEKVKYNNEVLRKAIANSIKQALAEKHETIVFDLESFNLSGNLVKTAELMAQSLYLTNYSFDKYKSKPSKPNLKKIIFATTSKATAKIAESINVAKIVTSSVNLARDLVNEVPNTLHSEHYAKWIDEDCKKNLKGVKVKILNKAEIKKEGMGIFLSVNAGSAWEPRLVHLTYTPKKVTPKTKHYAVVGKGITFDTGGYSLKTGQGMMGMKHDMAGSASMYAAFRAAALLNSPHKLTCILAITDNAVSSTATMPDSVVKGRNGKTVEILNTDAEGRLILADALDYACDQNPDVIIDAATLTGACIVALGSQVAAIMTNNQKLAERVLSCAKAEDEYMWQLPIIDEWRQDIKSKIADIKNIGSPGKAGTAIGAAFLEEFIKNDIAWAHLDIAGVADSASHLPYCPSHGASGVVIRTVLNFLMN